MLTADEEKINGNVSSDYIGSLRNADTLSITQDGGLEANVTGIDISELEGISIAEFKKKGFPGLGDKADFISESHIKLLRMDQIRLP